MPERSRSELLLRRALAWSVGWVVAAALYWLLIDITDLPELIVGVAAAVLAATGLELARERQLVGENVRLRWLAGSYRPLVKVPSDVAILCVLAIRQVLRPAPVLGRFRAVPFQGAGEEPLENGRRAIAQAFGSFAPNTIIVGIDQERELILAHQLHRTGGREAIDLLRLG